MTKLIAITGKTGVGKTYLIKKYNYKNIIFLDDYVKDVLYLNGHHVFQKITTIFGKNIITKDKINTSKLGKIVLNNFHKLEILTSIVNPQVRTYLKSLKNGTYIVETATYLKYENYFKDLFNKVILIKSNHYYSQNKFNYLDKYIETIKVIDIRYDYLIDRDKTNSTTLFFLLLDKLLLFK